MWRIKSRRVWTTTSRGQAWSQSYRIKANLTKYWKWWWCRVSHVQISKKTNHRNPESSAQKRLGKNQCTWRVKSDINFNIKRVCQVLVQSRPTSQQFCSLRTFQLTQHRASTMHCSSQGGEAERELGALEEWVILNVTLTLTYRNGSYTYR